tara:strand:- start:31062 stop:31676 length:615 start_codon:yes stop_codon:yes gene_type:complete
MDKLCIKIKNILSFRVNTTVVDAKILHEKRNINKNVDNKKYKLAAVLFPIIKIQDEYKVILTTRSINVLSHPGQVCFPGGRLESSDKNMVECAKREAFEEIGIEPNNIEVLGELDNCITGTDYNVTPILGLIKGNFIPKIQEKEVADLFEVPLNFFLDKSNRKLKNAEYKNKKYTYYEFQWGEKKIWGSTARIIVNFCDIIDNI